MIPGLWDRRNAAGRLVRGAVCLGVVLVLWPTRPALSQWPVGPVQNALAGSRIFGSKGCVQCHSINSLGGKRGPDLGSSPRRRSFYDFAAALWNHLPEMAAQMRELGIERPDLDPWEMGDLIAFFYWLDYFDAPGDVERGKQLFAEKRCVVCHQVGGVGGVVGPNLDFLRHYGSPIQIATAMWNHGSAMTEAMRSRGIVRPTFTGPDLVALLAYIGSSSPEPPEGPLYVLPGRVDAGKRIFVEKQCAECHSVRGQGGGVGPDLAEASRHRSLIEFAAAMWNKAPGMTKAMQARGISIPQMRAAEMADLVAYLYSIQYFGQSGDPEKGRRHVREKGCLNCHSLYGCGGASASDLGQTKGLVTVVAVVAALWNHTLAGGDRADGPAVPWPTLQPTEMADLAAFLQSSGRAD